MTEYKVSIEKLNSVNYASWSYQMKLLLMEADLWTIIEPGENEPNEAATANEKKAYISRQGKAQAKIALAICDEQQMHIRSLTTPKQIWEELQKLYAPKDSEFRTVQLRRKLYSHKLSDYETVENYLGQINKTVTELLNIGDVIEDGDLAMVILCGLSDEWDTVVSALCNLPENEFTCATIKRRLLAEDSRRRENINSSKQSAMFVKAEKTATSKSQNFKKKNEMKQYTTKGKNQKSEITCFYCKKTGHITRNCQKRLNSEKQNVVNMSAFCGTTIRSNDTWIIDSGATHHMAPKEEYFLTMDKSSHIEGITLADGRKASAVGKGAVNAEIKSDNSGSVVKFKTENTLLVPEIKCGILSVKQLIENNREVLFNEKGCFIYDKSGNLLMEAKEKDRLYVIHTEPMNESEVVLNSMMKKETKLESLDLWHRRMMHVSKHKILEMANANSVIGLNCKKSSPTPCDNCLIGKSTRQPFPKKPIDNVEKRTTILELVHSDLMGPIDVPSWGNKKYMLSIIDDASRYAFVQFLDNKGAALNEFKKWKTEIEKQTGKRLKRVRTDNGLEFCSKNWTAFCESTGIRHETTMTYTPQQNGIAERFNRTILDLVRSQIQESNLPKNSWAELIYTAAYIRNRVTNTHDNQKTPYELWTERKPSVRHLRAIGCEVFVHVPKQKRFSKLSKRAERGILIGYALHGRGYRVWMPGTQQVVESRDCVFKELSSEEPSSPKDDAHKSVEIQYSRDSSPHEYQDGENADRDYESAQDDEDAPISEQKPSGRPKKEKTKPKPEAVKEHKMTSIFKEDYPKHGCPYPHDSKRRN